MFPPEFEYQTVEIDEKKFEIRVRLSSEEDAQRWLNSHSEKTNTCWIVKDGLYSPQRLVYHKAFMCQHSRKNKLENSQRNTNCLATLDLKIKKLNTATKKYDSFLRRTVPFAGVIQGNIVHNHTINTSGSLRYLRISEDAKHQFIKLFNDGLGPAASIRQYQNNVFAEELNASEILASTRVNPSYNTVKYLFNSWRKTNYGGSIDCIQIIKEKIEYYSEKGIDINISEDFPWAVIILTPTMKRTQKLREAREIIFIDSTCSVDSDHSSLTVVVCATKAGALPLCFLIHQGQSEDSYVSAFKLLKASTLTPFGGHEQLVFNFMYAVNYVGYGIHTFAKFMENWTIYLKWTFIQYDI